MTVFDDLLWEMNEGRVLLFEPSKSKARVACDHLLVLLCEDVKRLLGRGLTGPPPPF